MNNINKTVFCYCECYCTIIILGYISFTKEFGDY